MGQVNQTRDALEAIIDTHGIGVALDMIGGICHDKSEHIKTNWQDKPLAIAWKRVGVIAHNAEHNVRKILGRLANGR